MISFFQILRAFFIPETVNALLLVFSEMLFIHLFQNAILKEKYHTKSITCRLNIVSLSFSLGMHRFFNNSYCLYFKNCAGPFPLLNDFNYAEFEYRFINEFCTYDLSLSQ